MKFFCFFLVGWETSKAAQNVLPNPLQVHSLLSFDFHVEVSRWFVVQMRYFRKWEEMLLIFQRCWYTWGQSWANKDMGHIAADMREALFKLVQPVALYLLKQILLLSSFGKFLVWLLMDWLLASSVSWDGPWKSLKILVAALTGQILCEFKLHNYSL